MTAPPAAATGSQARHGPLCILILAAGGSTRMGGRDKLLETVRGRTLLADRVETAVAALASVPGMTVLPATEAVLVALPPREAAPARWGELEDAPVRRIQVAGHRDGMGASLAAGVTALPATAAGVLVLPADMPDITADDIAALLTRFDGAAILRGCRAADRRAGHPVLFPARDFAALRALGGDRGGRDVLASASDRVRLVPLPGDHALIDLDTPEDWDRWRRGAR